MATPQIIVAKTYRLCNKIGEGSFGKIFLAKKKDAVSEERHDYAIKLVTDKNMWANELSNYQQLQGVKQVPFIHASGTEGKFHYIVMDLLEQNLEQLQSTFNTSLSLKVILHLGVQMVDILEEIHERGILHRDIKPSNFLLKTNTEGISQLYLIDFGLSSNAVNNKMKTDEPFIGTPRYMSVASQQGLTAGRRDDLESVGYILIFLQKGCLPWQSAPGDMALPIKQTFDGSYSKLICGEFILFIQYCRNLPFSKKPNYDYLRGLLKNLSSIL